MPAPFPSLPFPNVALGPPLAGTVHRIGTKLPIGDATVLNVFCASTCGPVDVTVQPLANETRQFHFRPECMVYNPLNRSIAGHVVVPIKPPVIQNITVCVTFTNNSSVDGEVSVFAAIDPLQLADQIVMAERRQLPAGLATSFHIVLIDQIIP